MKSGIKQVTDGRGSNMSIGVMPTKVWDRQTQMGSSSFLTVHHTSVGTISISGRHPKDVSPEAPYGTGKHRALQHAKLWVEQYTIIPGVKVMSKGITGLKISRDALKVFSLLSPTSSELVPDNHRSKNDLNLLGSLKLTGGGKADIFLINPVEESGTFGIGKNIRADIVIATWGNFASGLNFVSYTSMENGLTVGNVMDGKTEGGKGLIRWVNNQMTELGKAIPVKLNVAGLKGVESVYNLGVYNV